MRIRLLPSLVMGEYAVEEPRPGPLYPLESPGCYGAPPKRGYQPKYQPPPPPYQPRERKPKIYAR